MPKEEGIEARGIKASSRSDGRVSARRWDRWAMVIGLLALFLAVTVQKIWTADIWWQMRTGEWIWENKTWPRLDELSYTALSHEWIELRWVFCVWAWLTWEVGGAGLLILAKVIATALAFGLAAWPSRSVALRPVGATMIGLALVGGMSRWVVRPEMVTYVMVAAYLVVLERVQRGGMRRWGAAWWVLPVLQVVWTNSHTMFVMGPVVAWVWIGGEVGRWLLIRAGWRAGTGGTASEQPDPVAQVPRLAGIAGLVTGACVVNPWFVKGALFPLTLFREMQPGNVLGQNIQEFASPLSLPGLWLRWDQIAAAVLAAMAAASFVRNWRRLDLARLGVFVIAVYLTLLSQRNVGIGVVMVLWVGMRNVAEAVAGNATAVARPNDRKHRVGLRTDQLRGTLIGMACVAMGWFVATDRFAVMTGSPRETGVGVVWWNTARDAAEFAMRVGVKPQMYNWMQDGGYLTWRAKGTLPVFVDGRLEVYGEEFLEEFFRGRGEAWAALVDRWGINGAIVPCSQGAGWIVAAMRTQTPGWVAVHIDPHAIVFVRDVPEHAQIIRDYAIDPGRPYAAREAEPDEAASGWRAAVGCVGRPWYSEGMAKGFLLLGSAENAATYLERALRVAPEDEALRLALAQASFAARRFDVARRAYREALGESRRPAGGAEGIGTAEDWKNLGLCCEATGDPAGAMAAYTECVRLEPARAEVHNQMGILCAKQGDAAGAEKHFADAVAARPGYEEAARNLEFIRAQKKK